LKPSKKFLSLPIVTLSEGQHIGYVKSLVIDSHSKSLAALVIDPKGFFKDQRIIPYSKVVSVGDDAITIDKGVHVEKSTSLPEILTLIKEKLTVIGTRVITQSGKTLGVVEEYYVEPLSGKITQLEISGGKIEGFLNGKALLDADYITTIGQDVIVTAKGCESSLIAADKGLNDTFKSILHTTSNFASGTTHALGKVLKRDKKSKAKDTTVADLDPLNESFIDDAEASEIIVLDPADSSASGSAIAQEINEEITVASQDVQAAANEDVEKAPSTKEPLG
jgi:uncharacterized protein YrrD